MPRLAGKIAWITGAGSGIGEAAALALAEEGATTVLTGRRREPLEGVAARIQPAGRHGARAAGRSDGREAGAEGRRFIRDTLGRLDILVNNAGLNIVDRHWDKLTPEGIDELVHGNLSQALYCVTVALPLMRAQKDGVLIHTASMAGRFIGGFSGPIYSAAKHGVVAMSHTSTCRNASTASAPPCSCLARWRRRSSTSGPIRWDRKSARAWCSRRIAAT